MNNRGQGALEVTIFGMLLIIILYGMVSYAQRLSYLQQVKMHTFRSALEKAYKENGAANFLTRQSHRLVSTDGYLRGHMAATDSTAAVLWQKGISGSKGTTDEQSSYWIKVNDKDELPNPTYERNYTNFDGTNRTVKTPMGIEREEKIWDQDYTARITKKENAGGINYQKDASMSWTATDTFHFAKDKSVYNPNSKLRPVYEFNRGNETIQSGKTVSSQISWQTPHD